jgi:hypothetical protein
MADMKNAASFTWFLVKAAMFIALYLSAHGVAVVVYQQF